MAVLGSQGIVVKCMAFFVPGGCVRLARRCGEKVQSPSYILRSIEHNDAICRDHDVTNCQRITHISNE